LPHRRANGHLGPTETVDSAAAADAVKAALVSEVLIGPGGVRVERILVQHHLDRPAREMLLVRRVSYFVADCASVAGVAQFVYLASLMPEPRQP
jgi:hypothetical protein